MQIYGLKKCSTCRDALKALEAAGYAPHFTDLREDKPEPQVFEMLLAEFDNALLVNTRSMTWRNLDEAARQKPALELICTAPALVKRPAIIGKDGRKTLGWGKDVQAIWL